jgi:hypothetical protein
MGKGTRQSEIRQRRQRRLKRMKLRKKGLLPPATGTTPPGGGKTG